MFPLDATLPVPGPLPASAPAHRPSAGVRTTAETARRPARDGTVTVGLTALPQGGWRLLSALGDLVALAGVVCAFPLVILAIGIPVALLIRLLLWIAGAL